MRYALRLSVGCSLLVSLASGCPMSMSPTVDAGGTAMDAPVAPGIDAPIAPGTDAPIAPGVDARVPMMGPDAPTPMMGPDAPMPMMGTDAGAGPGVTCGTETCVDPQICCVTFGGGGMSTMTCSDAASCMGVAASCDGPEDCGGGEVCCGMRGAGGGGSTSCVPEADCGFGRLCRADTDCGMGDMCCAFMGVSVCSPFCP